MAGLGPVHHKVLERFVVAAGCTFVRQKGSHRVYWRADQVRPFIIPVYKQVPVFVVRNVLRQLRVTPDEFLEFIAGSR